MTRAWTGDERHDDADDLAAEEQQARRDEAAEDRWLDRLAKYESPYCNEVPPL